MRASDRAYRALLDDIVALRLAPGAVLQEIELAERLEMSRTPVREALGRLTSDGLVTAIGGRGLEVTRLDLADITALFELRLALETAAARLAARRGDPALFAAFAAEFDAADPTDPAASDYYQLVARFDEAIDQAVANRFLTADLDGVRTHLARVRRLAADHPTRLAASAREHALIARAIADGDPDLAANATHVHLTASLHHVRRLHRESAPTP